jgi:hypothetical protein
MEGTRQGLSVRVGRDQVRGSLPPVPRELCR